MSFFNRQQDKCFDRRLSLSIKRLTGFSPKNLSLYILALTPKSAIPRSCIKGTDINNERLEFLGDAILDAAISELLFKRFPSADEGFLTQMRTKIVNGKKLTELAKKIHLDNLIVSKSKQNITERIYEDAFEALIGAIYLDRGFKYVKQFVLQKIMVEHINLNKLRFVDNNFKSRIIEWSQKYKIPIEFLTDIVSETSKEFTAQLLINGKVVSEGKGISKKTAEQAASENALDKIDDEIDRLTQKHDELRITLGL